MPVNETIAYLFPGQGSQKPGMGLDLYNNFGAAKEVFQQADNALGFPLSKLCFEGPEEELRQTNNAQPALVTMSYASYRAAVSITAQEKVPNPAFLAGHSLGEYTALVFAGVLDFPTTVKLARERGRLMNEASRQEAGSMAAILGMDESVIKVLCQETGTWLANINCPGQLVISGRKENVEKAVAIAPARGASRAIMLQVSGAFHSPLMRPAAEGLSEYVSKLTFNIPAVPIVANTSAQPLTEPGAIKDELMKQLLSSVQWQRSIEYMIDKGVSTFIEIGAGKVLSGLVKRINRDAKTLNIGEISELQNLAG